MPAPKSPPSKSDAPNHHSIREELIDHLFILWAIAAFIAMAMSHWRALELGWELRDTIYSFLVAAVIFLTLCRRKIEVHVKATLFVVLNSAATITGLVNFGLMAAVSAVFPLSAMVIALFFRAKFVAWFAGLVFATMSLAALGFAGGYLEVQPSPSALMSSPTHWAVYSFSIMFMIMITSQIILKFRQATQDLYDALSGQKALLEKRNLELTEALEENKALRGIIPLCAHCSNVQTKQGTWAPLQDYLLNDSGADVSHGICPSCAQIHYPDFKFDASHPNRS